MSAGDVTEIQDFEPLTVFGLQCITVLNYQTQKVLAMLKLPAELILPGKFESVELTGGAEPYIVEAERTFAKGDAALKFHQVDEELFSLFGNATMTNNAASTGGSVSTPVNVVGTTAYGAASTSGVTTVAVKAGSEKDLKAGRYRFEVVAATTYNVYAMSDADFDGSPLAGAQAYVLDKTGLLNASPITLTSSATELVGFGITFNSVPAGSVAMTVGDAFTFEVTPITVESISGIVGMNPPKLTQVSLYVSTQKSEDGKIFNFYIPKARPFGFDLPLAEYKFGEPAPGMKIMYSRTQKMLYSWTMWKRMVG